MRIEGLYLVIIRPVAAAGAVHVAGDTCTCRARQLNEGPGRALRTQDIIARFVIGRVIPVQLNGTVSRGTRNQVGRTERRRAVVIRRGDLQRIQVTDTGVRTEAQRKGDDTLRVRLQAAEGNRIPGIILHFEASALTLAAVSRGAVIGLDRPHASGVESERVL